MPPQPQPMSSTRWPGFKRELGGDMRLLVGLRLLEAVVGVGEVGAAVLLVVVEEEFVELVAEVVMVRDVACARASDCCGRSRRLSRSLAPAKRVAPVALVLPAVGADDQLEQVEDRPVLDDQPPVHIGFAKAEPRVA